MDHSAARASSSSVLRKIKDKARVLAEEDYKKKIHRKNKSAFISRQTSRHYSELLQQHFKKVEKDKATLISFNVDCISINARLKNHVGKLQRELNYQELLGDLEGSPRRRN